MLSHFVALVAVAGSCCYVGLQAERLGGDSIRSDAYSYYVYLPSWFLHHDLTLESVAADCCGGVYPEFTALERWPGTGRWVNAHPIGTAVLMTPFFGVAHALTRWSNLTPDGFSLYYQLIIGASGFAYLLAGLGLLRELLVRYFGGGAALAALVTVTFGTNLLNYGVYDGAYSHAFSFFLICALTWLTDRWWAVPSAPTTAALGLVAGLVILTRYSNVVYLGLVPLFGLTPAGGAEWARSLWSRRWWWLLAGLVVAACLAPQVWLSHEATGHWLVSPYGRFTSFHFASPRLVAVLFSVQKGLFFWSPALLVAAAGVVVAPGWSRRLRLATVVAFVGNLYLIASWWDWQMGASFGHRGFTDGFGLAAVALAGFFSWVAQWPRVAAAVRVFVGAAVLLSVIQMAQFWMGILPAMDTTWNQYLAVFLRF
jgi:hypothetical protein